MHCVPFPSSVVCLPYPDADLDLDLCPFLFPLLSMTMPMSTMRADRRDSLDRHDCHDLEMAAVLASLAT